MSRALLAVVAFAAAAAHAAPPVEHFFQLPRFAQMEISPDGTAIATLSPVAGRQNLVILDIATRKARPITGFNERDVVDADWVNSKRLLFRTGRLGTQAFDNRGGGLFAVDKDGGNYRLLGEGGEDEQAANAVRLVYRFLVPVRRLPGDDDDIIAQELVRDRDGTRAGELFRVNTRTGRRSSLSLGKPDSGQGESWVVDDKGVPRALVVFSQGRVRTYYRAGPDAPWQKLHDFASTEPGWYPVAVADDDKTILVTDFRTRDKAAIVRYDPATRTFGEVVAEHPQVDLRGVVTDDGKPVGVSFQADRGGAAWFDPSLARIQRTADAALPNAVNRLSWSRDRSLAVIQSSSDVSPGAFYLLDMKGGKLEWLVDRAPWVDPKEMAPMRPVRYAARDGLSIPAYLTLPKTGDRNLPMVVLVHGGPWVDGDMWSFDPEAQFLASRGYAVLQPNFRGTTRYGWKHFASSFGQWGLAMQDDVTDGVKWAVEQGIADPKRICIFGASYGGYATMMGLVKTPELYRCGINYVGVTDVNLFLTASWADYAESDFIRYSVKQMVGDASKDAERLKSVSPVEQASRIRVPVLMAYGGEDFRVPIEHGTRMRDALERNGLKPIWMVMPGEGHGFRDPKNQKEFYEAVEKFLADNLGDRPRF